MRRPCSLSHKDCGQLQCWVNRGSQNQRIVQVADVCDVCPRSVTPIALVQFIVEIQQRLVFTQPALVRVFH